jgi:bifunctional non-homologous end joining protein LigD
VRAQILRFHQVGEAHPHVARRAHWVRPELVDEVKYLAWTSDNLLRRVVYEGLREDKPAIEVRREMPHPKT